MMEYLINQDVLDSVSERTIARLNGPSYGIEKKIDNYAELYGEEIPDKAVRLVSDVFSVYDILADKLPRSVYTKEFISLYAAFAAGSYGLYRMGESGQDSQVKTINPYNVHDLDFSKPHPLPREEMIKVFAKSIGRFNGIGLMGYYSMFFSWMQENARTAGEKYCNDYPHIVDDISVVVGKDFTLRGFSKDNPIQSDDKNENDLTWDDFAGYGEVVGHYKDLALIINNLDYALSLGTLSRKEILPKGTLLYGLPGTGKNFINKIFISETGVPNVYCAESEVANSFVHGGAQNIKAVFEKAANISDKEGICMVFMDEIDGFLHERNSNHQEDGKVVDVFNEYMDGAKAHDGVFVSANTNNYSELDDSVKSRFHVKYFMGAPDLSSLKDIFKVKLSRRTGGRSIAGADIENIIKTSGVVSAGANSYEELSNNFIWTGRVVDQIVFATYRKKLIDHLRNGTDPIPIASDYIKYAQSYRAGSDGI